MFDKIGKALYWVYDSVTMYNPVESGVHCLEDLANGLGKSIYIPSDQVDRAEKVLTKSGIKHWSGDKAATGQGHLAVDELDKAIYILRKNGIDAK